MFELMVALAERNGVRLQLLSLADGPLRTQYEAHGIDVLPLPFEERWLRHCDTIDTAIEILANFLVEQRASLVYANTLLGYPVIHAAAKVGVPSVWNIRESQGPEYWQTYLGNRLALAFDAFAVTNAVVFVADATRRFWSQNVKFGRNHLIPNALNLTSFGARFSDVNRAAWRRHYRIDQNATVFLCVGTLHERKGQMDLLHAIVQLPAGDSAPVAVCVGDTAGDYSRRAHAFRDSLPNELQERITLLPKQVMVGDAYRAADVFVCCSRNESYPRIILEAMASSMPVVTTPVFGISEQVQFGRNALRYEPGHVDGLAKHMQMLHCDPSRRKAYGDAGAVRMRELSSFDDMVEKYMQVFLEVAGGV